GHFDNNTAYAAVNRIRLDDMKPHIYRTKDGGKTWKEIVNGLPDDPVNVVREDPVVKGLLFAGSEIAVYVSFDDGEHWQSLRLNMPATSIRDLVVKDDDLVIGTHGRSFWILDDISTLRSLPQLKLNYPSRALRSVTFITSITNAYRVRWDMYTDTPIPQEEPAGENPPDGIIFNYFLGDNVLNPNYYLTPSSQSSTNYSLNENREVILEITDANKKVIRKFSNKDTLYKIPLGNVPSYWIRPQEILSDKLGGHRFVWDMHYTPLPVSPSYPIAAIYKNTAPDATSPWVMPGKYIANLYVDGKVFAATNFYVKMDPRVKTPLKDLQLQHDLSLEAYNNRKQIIMVLKQIAGMRNMLEQQKSKDKSNAPRLLSLDENLAQLQNAPRGSKDPGFNQLLSTFASIHNVLQDSDTPPTQQTINAMVEARSQMKALMAKWNDLNKQMNFD
ncbi:MAG: WD40/YVTN/BNR-like repeat-containing protein, partial [Flavisolibacter sp.]